MCPNNVSVLNQIQLSSVSSGAALIKPHTGIDYGFIGGVQKKANDSFHSVYSHQLFHVSSLYLAGEMFSCVCV